MDASQSSGGSQDTTEDLLRSIEQYKNQLDVVNAALESADESSKAELEELQLNLINILELTLHQLDLLPKGNLSTQENSSTNHDETPVNNLDDEFEKFKSEIAELEGPRGEEEIEEVNSGSEDEAISKKIQELQNSLKELEGETVRAPFMERWGGFSYHNAIVLSTITNQDQPFDIENPEILVLFSQPTSVSMLPCRFFLDGKCKFSEDKCKFSHGKRVSFNDVKEYKEPVKDDIVSGTRVLSLHEGQDIWHPGTVEDVLENRAGFSFNCSVCKQVVETSLESMVPLYAHDDPQEPLSEAATVSRSDHDEEDETAEAFATNAVWLQNSLGAKLGEWEKYTKGIGSKLMAKMGYVVGTGLGPKGEGKVDPVTAYVYPQGVSLDHCMHLRESSKGGDLLEVEKRLLSQQKKNEAKAKRQNLHLRNRTSVFDIINNKLSFKESKPTLEADEHRKKSVDVTQSVLKSDSVKDLNRKNFQLSSSIEKLNGEVLALKKTRSRQERDLATVKAIDRSLEEKLIQLSDLQKAEKQIEKEQTSRKNRQKFCSF